MRRLLLILLLVAAVWILVANRGEFQRVTSTLATGEGRWIIAALLLQAMHYIAWGLLYRSAFATVGVASRLSGVLAILLASMFVNVVVPSAGVAGAALFVDDAARRGQSASRATAAVALVMAADFAALALVLAGSLAGLTGETRSGPIWFGGVVVVTSLLGLSTLLFWGVGHPRWLGGLLRHIQNGVARLARRAGRRSPLSPEWAEQAGGELSWVSGILRERPGAAARLLTIAVAMHALNAVSLAALFPAFRLAIAPAPLLAGYALGIAVWILSPIPQGIGIVEAVITLIYAAAGVPAEAAAAVALAFRGLTFWIPMVVGILVLRRLHSFRGSPRP